MCCIGVVKKNWFTLESRLWLSLVGLHNKEAVTTKILLKNCSAKQLNSSDCEYDGDVAEVENSSFYGVNVEPYLDKPECTEEEMLFRPEK